jgi:hypothetical protein
MENTAGTWRTKLSGLARLVTSPRGHPEEGREDAPRILAIVSRGPNHALLRTISQDFGWELSLSDTPPGIYERRADVPPIVIYDRELSPYYWRDVFGVLTRQSPRPYVILLSPTTDQNLWDDLQRVGGSDILRSPVNRDNLFRAVRRAWLFWRSQQMVRATSPPAS